MVAGSLCSAHSVTVCPAIAIALSVLFDANQPALASGLQSVLYANRRPGMLHSQQNAQARTKNGGGGLTVLGEPKNCRPSHRMKRRRNCKRTGPEVAIVSNKVFHRRHRET